MIISPPFLPTRNTGETEQAYLKRAMAPAAHGPFAVADDLVWHGGVHLEAPAAGANGREKVRAIADGTVIYARRPTARPGDITTHVLGYKNWSDDGCVVIRHDTAIGADANDQETLVRFFSIYMHLGFIAAAVKQGERILRKAEIGTAGTFEGTPHILHLEIICDDENLAKLIGRSTPALNISQDGRTDALFGQMYFHLPADTPVYTQRPDLHLSQASGHAPLSEELFVGLLYGGGNAQVSAWRPDGSSLATTVAGTGMEYSLYTQAGNVISAYRAEQARLPAAQQASYAVPAHSAVYELLRFGRVTGPDPLHPADTPHWREIPTAQGNRWVNLNTTAITRFSDADAPHWRYWHLLEASNPNDSRAEVAAIAALPGLESERITTGEQAQTAVERDTARERLARTICKFPTEWQKSSIRTRWQWLIREGPGAINPNSLASQTHMTEEAFGKFIEYTEALCFWDEASVGISHEHWHFQPQAFIEHFRMCGWLSEDEFSQIYPQASTKNKNTYRVHINKCTNKYLLTEPIVLSHFLGQAAVESNQLRWMGELYNGDPNHYFRRYERARNFRGWLGNVEWNDGGTYRGRGFKQLTGRSNYFEYWKYRNWIKPATTGNSWWSNVGWWGIRGQYIPRQHQNLLPTQDPAIISQLIQQMRPPIINNPDRVKDDPYNCIDTAGWFWTKNNLLPIARANNSVQLTNRIRGDNAQNSAQFPPEAHYPDRLANTNRIFSKVSL